ncbi:hypothetical protein [Kocuria sp.]|nr:hypothetical protein [Kocuria sp.]MDO4919922.1 hypothetical protein [Kocuria sp.]
MLTLILAYALTGAAACGLMAAMVVLLVGVALYTDWRDGVRA